MFKRRFWAFTSLPGGLDTGQQNLYFLPEHCVFYKIREPLSGLWQLITDEPEQPDELDLGQDPYTPLLSSPVACTLATLRMYIDHKGLAISEIEVRADMFH